MSDGGGFDNDLFQEVPEPERFITFAQLIDVQAQITPGTTFEKLANTIQRLCLCSDIQEIRDKYSNKIVLSTNTAECFQMINDAIFALENFSYTFEATDSDTVNKMRRDGIIALKIFGNTLKYRKEFIYDGINSLEKQRESMCKGMLLNILDIGNGHHMPAQFITNFIGLLEVEIVNGTFVDNDFHAYHLMAMLQLGKRKGIEILDTEETPKVQYIIESMVKYYKERLSRVSKIDAKPSDLVFRDLMKVLNTFMAQPEKFLNPSRP